MIENDYRDKKFLIIDDFENFQRILKAMLTELNAKHVDTASNGLQAIQRCQDHDYDVVFGDFDLGKGRNGLQTLEELRHSELLKSSAIYIMVTAESSKEAVIGSMEYKPDAYLAKPVSPGELKARLVKCLKQKEALKPIYKALDASRYAEAITLCDKEINAETRHKNWCRKTKGNLLLKLQNFHEAIVLYKAVVDQRPVHWALIGLAKALEGEGRTQEAYDAYQEVIKNNPACLEAYEGSARLLIELDRPKDAQDVLEQTNTISAHSATRQRLLTDVSKLNGDLVGAAKASRNMVRLSEHTRHYKVENHLELADNLNEAARILPRKKAKEFAKEALKAIKAVEKKVSQGDLKAKSKLIEARVQSSLRNKSEAEKALEQAEKAIGNERKAKIEVRLELAKSYLQTENKEKADSLINDLVADYGNNTKVANEIDKLVDEPVTKSGKNQVVSINKKGIKLYESGDYEEAAQYFGKAIRHFPKHVGIRLNLIQSLLNLIKKNGVSEASAKECATHIASINHIEADHPQYDRYKSLYQAVVTVQKSVKPDP